MDGPNIEVRKKIIEVPKIQIHERLVEREVEHVFTVPRYVQCKEKVIERGRRIVHKVHVRKVQVMKEKVIEKVLERKKPIIKERIVHVPDGLENYCLAM